MVGQGGRPARPITVGWAACSARSPRSAKYALIRLVPRIERGEQINVGVLFYCQQRLVPPLEI
ncbi:DUF3037 domain-containing protein [Micromonospora sp. DT201]|uniref:DUF3037 domain-containing protein n=1 Tax=Micromonospora sp. DT201 TaxID=3393442 RepID=UPI003CF1C318